MADDFQRFEVTVEAQAMREARSAIERYARAHGLDERRVADLALAVSEAMFNVMDHGHLRDGKIHLDARAASDGVEIGIESGCSDADREDFERQLASPLTDEPPDFDLERGRGLFLIRKKTDSVRVEFEPGACVRLVLVKRR